jgi:hypothetical protein
MLGKSTLYSAPIPIINKDSKIYSLLLVGIRQLEISLKPANTREILTLLAKLRLHFASSVMSEEEVAILLEDYLTDLAPYPADIIEQACIEYRKDGKNLFFPKIGQLLTLMDKYWYPRKFKLKKLNKLLELSNQQQKE